MSCSTSSPPRPRIVDTQYGFDGVDDRRDPHHLDAHHRRRRGAGRLRLPLRRAEAHAVRPRHARDRAEPRGGADGRHPPAGRGAQRRGAGDRPVRAGRRRDLAPIQLVTPTMGQSLIFKAFALIIIGGLGNIPGAIAAAIGARPDRELDRRLLRDRLAGDGRLRDHDRGAAAAARRAVQAGSHARRMKVARRPRRCAACSAPCRYLTSSNYIIGIAVSALHLHGRRPRRSTWSTASPACCPSPSSASGASAATPRR